MSRLIPKTLPGRLAMTFTAMFVVLLLAFALVLYREVARNDRARAIADTSTMTAALAIALGERGRTGDEDLNAWLEQVQEPLEGRLAVLNAEGAVVAVAPPEDGALPNRLGEIEPLLRILDSGELGAAHVDGETVLAVARVPGSSGEMLVYDTTRGELGGVLGRFWGEGLVAALLASAIVATLSLVVARRISAPLDEMRAQALAVSSGDLNVTVTPADTSELGDLARAFNTMTRQISALVFESESARARLEVIFESLNDGVIVVDRMERVLAINPRAGELLSLPATRRMAGEPFVVAVRDNDLVTLLRQTLAVQTPTTGSLTHARSGRELSVTATPATYGDQPLAIVVLRDVTELRRLESVRREFVANVSHELRTPLASIRAVVETLEAGAIDDPEVSLDFLGRIIHEVDRLTTLVEELLDLGRLESGRIQLQFSPVAIGDLLQTGAERLRPQIDRAGLELQVLVDDATTLVLVDRARIEQVLLNLVHNAVKFTPPGGIITVHGEEEHGLMRVDVSDTGGGIPESELPRIFERFYKADRARRSEGTGLGLAIAKHIVQIHGGGIWVVSTEGEGATFSFTLPLAERRDGEVTDGAPADQPTLV